MSQENESTPNSSLLTPYAFLRYFFPAACASLITVVTEPVPLQLPDLVLHPANPRRKTSDKSLFCLYNFYFCLNRGRDGPFGPPPAQIRTGGFTAYGSYLGC